MNLSLEVLQFLQEKWKTVSRNKDDRCGLKKHKILFKYWDGVANLKVFFHSVNENNPGVTLQKTLSDTFQIRSESHLKKAGCNFSPVKPVTPSCSHHPDSLSISRPAALTSIMTSDLTNLSQFDSLTSPSRLERKWVIDTNMSRQFVAERPDTSDCRDTSLSADWNHFTLFLRRFSSRTYTLLFSLPHRNMLQLYC